MRQQVNPDQITFTLLSEDELEWARQLHNDPEVLKMLTDPHEVNPEEQIAWFQNLKKSKSSQRWVIWYQGIKIGIARLDQIDSCNKNICIGLDIHKDHRGKGLAKPIYRELFKYWFETQEFNRIWLITASYNIRARNLYTGLGFLYEGCYRESLFKDERYYDCILMGLLKKEYLLLKEGNK